MEIHQLKYFICVAKLESISKAATMLHLSQPALSKSLAKAQKTNWACSCSTVWGNACI